MHQKTAQYLEDYIGALDAISHQDRVYSELSDWHFKTKPGLISAVSELNDELGLTDRYQLRPHIATTAIGRLDRELIVMSANPGYSARPMMGNPERQSKSALEDSHRSANTLQNAEFCRHFFEKYPTVSGGSSPYWTKVMRLLTCYQGGENHVPHSRIRLWEMTAQADILGGIDLLPFHSTSDGVTRRLYGKGSHRQLRNVALATLRMALRLSPKRILVTSRPGHELITDLIEALEQPLTRQEIKHGHSLYAQTRSWKINSGRTTIISFPYQIFSGSFRHKQAGYTHTAFAEVLRTRC